MKTKVVCVVLNNFTNDSRVLKEATSLAQNNYDVEVVALHEKGLKESENTSLFPISRLKLKTRNWSKSKPIQLLKYFEFFLIFVKRFRNADIIHCNDLNTLPFGVFIKKILNKKLKVIYDAHEYETERNGLSNKGRKVTFLLERFLIKYSDEVITVSNSIADEYKRLYNIKKPSLVLNCPYFCELREDNLFREELGIRENQKIFLYQGGLFKGRGIELLLKSFSNLSDNKNVIVFMGYGTLEETILEHSQNHRAIFFHKAVSPDVLLRYTSSADYGISLIDDICLSYRYCLPNKFFEYIMAGLPIISSNLPEMKKIVEDHNIGIIAEQNTKNSFQKAVEATLDLEYSHITKNLANVRREFCWEKQEKTLIDTYNSLLN
ncbi:glycosyltransferase family 4 protein [Lentisphaera profundi]|uniref:Glycosyltransferase family 4 protein n=1 Tax=Lentisphaera profundi TaxID=1658616 RepID=A0ABY7W0S3_9BACT|nr:glycosyltransferase family 4 protein [Lentisphaera profundi]WDE99149.1 glycosyltransferase family 4 protein [Lentisphaera profundi]